MTGSNTQLHGVYDNGIRSVIARLEGMSIDPECRWWTEHVDVRRVRARTRSESGCMVSSRRESWRGTHSHMVRLVSNTASSLARLGSSSGLGVISMGLLSHTIGLPWRNPLELTSLQLFYYYPAAAK